MRYIFIWVLVLVLQSCGDDEEKILPQKAELTESVYASATVQPDSLYKVYSAVGGILDRNLVEEGDRVKKGSPLLQIINNTPKLNTENAKLSLRLAQENYNGSAAVLKGLEDEIKAATLSFHNDSINFYRQKRLWSQNIGSKVEFDNRKLAYELSRNNLNLLKSKYERTKNELLTQVRQARNNYESAQINTKDFTVTSKINGKVYELMKEPGEIVSTMEPIAAVGSDSDFIIKMLVDEVDIVKLSLGQKTLVTLDAYPSEVFVATVDKIYPRKDERSQTFTVEASFDDPPKILYPGLAGEGNIIIAQKKEALTIPKTYLINGNSVRTAKGMVEVVTGLQNLDRVEIVEGIGENTELLKPEQ
ncbi:efflux RND transporter periplasmic adaptor subunit [Zobellia galactanivorans]|uniref:Membrane fusion protein n=1 Tax=Zobellia galactanivorans (strain DSM 12802 / CCUG 47099 / CIP 106680 / NCIMB 13871 / Dsij) TaxID=63186 RepID=G0L142_ZOBGA|nr:efflux RND transporter periplasmic adaptor subunit [Zobellia galactanivorans]MDO6809728.1 efflux RND transporter periplasmic adaptor subunit [Zobellia galactanivorans]CAZ97627.1 Membrane fusion protein [Zobellia galactanivorans]